MLSCDKCHACDTCDGCHDAGDDACDGLRSCYDALDDTCVDACDNACDGLMSSAVPVGLPLTFGAYAVSRSVSRMCTTDYNCLSLCLQDTRRVLARHDLSH